MQRRRFLKWGGLVVSASWLGLPSVRGASAIDAAAVETMRKHWQTLVAPSTTLVTATPALTRSKDEWRKLLPPDSYAVLFEEDTERPASSALNAEKSDGIFACRACALPLFTSAMKYDSGTGWPSFITSIPDHLATKNDFKLLWPRTEYHCVKCGGHQGHMFDDGPAPTRQRWCNNGVALSFVPTRA